MEEAKSSDSETSAQPQEMGIVEVERISSLPLPERAAALRKAVDELERMLELVGSKLEGSDSAESAPEQT